MGEFEAAGEIVTGGLLGRAMEPRAGEGHKAAHHMCLNCGTALIGPHCHRCGQAGHVHRSLHAIGHEIVHGVFHFEGKFWRTLPLLTWRPGDLTRRYIAGERARFVSPMAIFLFSIFAMFAVFSFAGLSAPTEIAGLSSRPAAAIEQAKKDATEEAAEARKSLGELPADSPKREKYERRIASAQSELESLEKAGKYLVPGEPDQAMEVHTGWYTLDHGIEKWKKNPSLMLYKLQSSVYKFSWLLIPLSLPFVWLLFFWKREYKLYDHAIFITYSIAFMSLLFIVLTVAGKLGVSSGWLALAGLLIPFIHVTRQLQQAYQLQWWSATARAIVLTQFISIVLTLFMLILVAMGMMG
ncbi:DUF3667 domain-containing protein [Sphingomonas psychrotolerans]|uniref:DUF3667 domain-containing protein n=1 Tax=Sphingomonas psychrotolerans TaxID=1327635 RepID=A0ABU3N813_9SPHN|nr:DUF3667 domain-containing protein [Sphingomonas psychrotolerans]MDT8760014.1 DUF3667 domain-containing protein [Sphingomonas psychrotolerans]